MSLFPNATFAVFFPSTGAVPGTRAEGTLKVEVPEDIPRADHIHLFWRTRAIAGYGAGKSRHVYRQDLFVAPLEVKLDRTQPLKAGSYSYPFAIDLPANLPPSYAGSDCSISHRIEVRLDVDWAVDPKASVTPIVQMAPIEIMAEPIATRSPPGFHDKFVVDLKIDRQCFAEGEPVTGQVALRSGQEARFDAITIAVASMATIKMARGERRRGHGSTIRIPAEFLRSGESVPFSVHYNPLLVPETFRNGFIDHDVYVVVEVDIPWASDPAFELPIQMLPAGSRIHLGGQNAVIVGTERLVRLAEGMAAATGFARGRLPTLVEGRVGPVGVTMTDSPHEGKLGVDIAFAFPDLELVTEFRRLSLFEGFRQSPLLPKALDSQYFLRVGKKLVGEAELSDFYAGVLGGFESTSDLRLTDHHLDVRQPLLDDGAAAMTSLAQWTRARAEIIAQAIARLPFAPAHAAAAPAWIATAVEQNAFLLPHLPAITGLVLSSRIAGGEQRTINLELRTRQDGTIAAELDLRNAPLPRAAWADLDKGTELPGLRPVRAVFTRIDVHTIERITLEGSPFAPDPRALLSTLETFFWWLLETRGERRADAPYR